MSQLGEQIQRDRDAKAGREIGITGNQAVSKAERLALNLLCRKSER